MTRRRSVLKYTPPQWRVAFPIVVVALIALAGTLLLALHQGTRWAAVLSGGVIAGVLLAIAWAMRHFLPGLSAALVVLSALPLVALWRLGPEPAAIGLFVAACVLAAWYIIYDLGVTARANTEVVSPVVSGGRGVAAGRALIVYHSTHGIFQPRVQRALAEGLQAEGWSVDTTTASRATPVDLSRYDLLVLGAPSYNWQPARPVLAYLARLGDLASMPVALVVSGGGMTERATRILAGRVARAHGRIVDAIEIWTTRSNTERHGTADPEEIMRRTGARLALLLRGDASAQQRPLHGG